MDYLCLFAWTPLPLTELCWQLTPSIFPLLDESAGAHDTADADEYVEVPEEGADGWTTEYDVAASEDVDDGGA